MVSSRRHRLREHQYRSGDADHARAHGCAGERRPCDSSAGHDGLSRRRPKHSGRGTFAARARRHHAWPNHDDRGTRNASCCIAAAQTAGAGSVRSKYSGAGDRSEWCAGAGRPVRSAAVRADAAPVRRSGIGSVSVAERPSFPTRPACHTASSLWRPTCRVKHGGTDRFDSGRQSGSRHDCASADACSPRRAGTSTATEPALATISTSVGNCFPICAPSRCRIFTTHREALTLHTRPARAMSAPDVNSFSHSM